ncbi:MAG: sulfite exporter TauE/SafE family protein [Chloroflexota bacterium]
MLRDLVTVLAGLLVGVASGILGVGGGILFVPLMTIGFGMPQHLAQGTSLAAIIPTSVVGAVTHDRRANVLRWAALLIALGAVAGAVIGALIALRLPRELLARAFAVMLLFAAYRLWPRKPDTVSR